MARRAGRVIGCRGRRARRTDPGREKLLQLLLHLGMHLGVDPGLEPGLEPGLDLSLHVGLQLLHVSPQLRQLIANPRSSASGGRRGMVSHLIGKHSRTVAAETVDAALSDPTYSLEEHLSLLGPR